MLAGESDICSATEAEPVDNYELITDLSPGMWKSRSIDFIYNDIVFLNFPPWARNYNASLELRKLKLSIDFSGCEK